ncbi:hypothetical protein BCR42DRAFT_424523 [Absidia repens]|uniref:Xylanolytic transcriptional activator regulatory domain-containing protein n=1 Tax=Absidia repens TaxID=90262 RepID=A0A1X2I523_9FUNG|nr:hypothetical protein BCR42DRAFT_424523 [Absidia repens]
MPFDTVEHSHKRLRCDGFWENPEDAGYQFAPTSHIWDTQPFESHSPPANNSLDINQWKPNSMNGYQAPFHKINTDYLALQRQRKISTPSQFSSSPTSDYDVLTSPTFYSSPTTAVSQEDADTYSTATTTTTTATNTSTSTSTSLSSVSSSTATTELCRVRDILNKCSIAYTSTGVNVEAKVSNATELRSLVDAFSKLCPSIPTPVPNNHHHHQHQQQQTVSSLSTPTGITLYRNKLYKSKPVNFFASVCNLSHMILPSSSRSKSLSLRQIGDACIETYFTCWVRNSPIINKSEFMSWYHAEPDPMNSLIVNAICALVFAHTVNHHTKPGLEIFKHDQDLVLQQKDLFFDRARNSLEIYFDSPDRWTVAALLFMSCTAEPDRRHHYSGMATCALLELDIYPRMVDDDNDSFEKEMDTRLWWFAWSIDFYLYSTGVPRNTPLTNRKGQVDMPRIYEEDIDEVEHGVLADIHCLKWWKFQSDVIADVYEQDNMTAEQLRQYDDQLLQMYQELPRYLQLDSGFVYGCDDLFMVCVRVNIEFNATRIILHMPFLPDATNLHPTPVALQSLNVCLKTALIQLRTISSCNEDSRRCAFDRDELWRAGELISLSMDVYRNCSSPTDRDILLKDIRMDDYTFGLHKALSIMQASSEFKMGRQDWVQVSDWLKDEINRHNQLDTATTLHHQQSSHDFSMPIKKEIDLPSSASALSSSPLDSTSLSLSVMSFPPASTSSSPQQRQPTVTEVTANRKASTSTSSSDFISFCPTNRKQSLSTKKQPSQRQQAARFRYFNPRTMNKFLFIDDHPLL